MAKTLPFKLITPVAVAFEGEAELVIAVGTEGEEGILPSHAPFLTALRPGILRANVVAGEGFMQALPDRLTVLVDEAVPPEQVDVAAAHAEREAALIRQRDLTPQTTEYAREQAIVDFANAKLALPRSA
jgi:F-type H+-transporting ATPase subunit epsilon